VNAFLEGSSLNERDAIPKFMMLIMGPTQKNARRMAHILSLSYLIFP
jgi:hypothetical protein